MTAAVAVNTSLVRLSVAVAVMVTVPSETPVTVALVSPPLTVAMFSLEEVQAMVKLFASMGVLPIFSVVLEPSNTSAFCSLMQIPSRSMGSREPPSPDMD